MYWYLRANKIACEISAKMRKYRHYLERRRKKMKKKKKSLTKKAGIGASLLMSSVLLCGNTVKAHAQADLTPEESQKLTEFLATQPTNGARTSLGLTNNVSHSTYKFKGRNNYTSIFESRATKTKLDKDYDFVLYEGDHAGETLHVKNWQDLDVFNVSTADTYGPDYSMGKYMFAKQVTFVTDDGTEITERNVALPVDFDDGERFDKTAYPNRYVFDYPIEAEDSRFTHDIMGAAEMAATGGTGYWQITATVNEEIPYDTIAEIDENLKQGEVVEITQGEIGNKIGTFNLTIGDDLGSKYLDYDADFIYNDLKDLFSTSSIQKDAFFVRDWGMATFVEGGSVDPKTRMLHVGIDYTQYVTEDGTELKTKEYGVHDKETFEGYEFVETRIAENGDTVHVYKKVTAPTPTPEPEQPATPANPVDETPVQPETPTQPETPADPTPTPEPETPVNPTNPGDSGNVNGGNDEDPTPANPTNPTPETPVQPETPSPEQPGTPTTPVEETPAVPTPEPEAPVTPADPTPEAPVEDQPVVPADPTPEVPNTPAEPTPEAPVKPEEPATPTDSASKQTTETQNSNENTSQNSNGNTTEETKSSKKNIIETGVRSNIFLSLSMAVIALFAGLFVLKNKKN